MDRLLPFLNVSCNFYNLINSMLNGNKVNFEIDIFRKKCLLEGLDDIGLTLQNEKRIQHH